MFYFVLSSIIQQLCLIKHNFKKTFGEFLFHRKFKHIIIFFIYFFYIYFTFKVVVLVPRALTNLEMRSSVTYRHPDRFSCRMGGTIG